MNVRFKVADAGCYRALEGLKRVFRPALVAAPMGENDGVGVVQERMHAWPLVFFSAQRTRCDVPSKRLFINAFAQRQQ